MRGCRIVLMPGLIRREDIDEVRSRTRIEDVVSQYVSLRPAGADSHKGLCPFHDEKTPSFHVRPSVGRWHCFGCGEGGDVISFVERIERIPFVEAVELLARKVGVDLRYEDSERAERRPDGPARSDGPARGLSPHRVSVDASGSSQFLSALLLVGPLLPGGLAVTAVGHITSLPHVTMTVAGLRERGIVVEGPEEPEEPEGPGEPGEPGSSAGPADPSADTSGSGRTWIVHPGRPAGGRAGIEPDLSNAGPFLAAALIAGGEVRLPGWPAPTTQAGDAWRELLPRLGGDVELRDGPEGVRTLVVRGAGASSLRGIDADLSAVGELTPVVAALAALASEHGHPSRLRGIAHLRGHETDRLAALVTEITRVGGIARQTDDGLMIDALPAGDRLHPALLRSYADHRIAAFAALIGLGVPGTELDDVECTSKTLPDFPALWAGLLGREPSRGLDQSGVPR